MIFISLENKHEQIAIAIRDFLLSVIDENDFDYDVRSQLTFIEINGHKIGSYIHRNGFDNKLYLTLYESKKDAKEAKKFDIAVDVLETYWG